MNPFTRLRLFFAQLIMMLSFLFLGMLWVRDQHWPTYYYWVNIAIAAFLGFLIPSTDEAYQKTSGMSSTMYWILCVLCGPRYAGGRRFLSPRRPDWPGNWPEEPQIVRCHSCDGTQVWSRNKAGEIEVYHDCWSGKHAREVYANLERERDEAIAELARLQGQDGQDENS